ncbi:MAG: sulfatase-like hydrolase/transferase [Gammaproteobacteria bacterium]|nr:sulfatase-like hydrolase/transferase [Gammaproteobacteria bacterium]
MINLVSLMRPIAPLAWLAISILAFLSLSRTGLVIWQWDRVMNSGDLAHLFFSGLRMDIVLVAQIMLLPIFALILLPTPLLRARLFTGLIGLWCVVWSYIVVFMELVTPAYMEFFETRPGRIFFEYLDHPQEVSSLVYGAYLTTAVISLCLPVITTLLILKKLRFDGGRFEFSVSFRLVVLIPVFLMLSLGARSTLGHRPVNPSTFAKSKDQLVNELFLNSTYSLLYAVYSLRHEDGGDSGLPEMEQREVVRSYQRISTVPMDNYLNPQSTHHQFGDSSKPGSLKNIVIIVEESLGARFVGSLGGVPLTPNLDAWSNKGLWLTNLYATGIRSARGLEAIVSGFPPSSSRSVLKLGKSQGNFYTMAHTLSEAGYRNYFVYGGEGHFDNMKGFFLSNGFDTAIDINDYDEFEFKGTWGVSDEDLFNRAHSIMLEEQSPFFTLIFTSSFHSPYEFPDGKIALDDEEKNTKHNGVKYADYALGQYLEKASQSKYWKDSIFLIVADHDERPRGRSLVPIESYHIPGLIIADGLTPRHFDKVASHIDLLPTLLFLANVSGTAPFVGHNLLSIPPDHHGRAIMQFGKNHAYMEGENVVIHQPDRAAEQYLYTNKTLIPTTLQQDLARKALIWASLPGVLYREKLYTPDSSTVQPP